MAGPAAIAAPARGGWAAPRLPWWSGTILVAAAVTVPWICASVLWSFYDGTLSGPGAFPGCAFMEATGIPCPGCGTLRSLYLGVHGDPAFLDYNPVGATAVGVVWLLGLRSLVASIRYRHPPAPARGVLDRFAQRPVAATAVTLALSAAGWAVALVNAPSIGGG